MGENTSLVGRGHRDNLLGENEIMGRVAWLGGRFFVGVTFFRSLVAFVVLVSFSSSFAAPSPNEMVRAFQHDVRAFMADFSQVVISAEGQVLQESSGRVVLARPFRFYWDYQQPFEQLIVSNGKKVWFYDADLEQVTVKNVGGPFTEGIVGLLTGNRSVENEFTFESVAGEDGLDWVVARPRKGVGEYRQFRLGFRKGEAEVVELTDGFGQRTRVVFSKLQRNPSISKGQFEFVPPPGVDVLRGG